jgi:replicative DNA helicase
MIIVAPGLAKEGAGTDTPANTDRVDHDGRRRGRGRLLSADGQPTRAVAATEVMLGRPCYEIKLGGTVIVADAEHQWLTETRATESAQPRGGLQPLQESAHVRAIRTTAEIAASLRCNTADRRLNHSVVNARV